jgi:outer membrane lipoprotein-sorting protein
MTRTMLMVCIAAAALTSWAFVSGDPSGADVLKRIEAQVAGVNDYTVTLDVVADIEHLKVPPMHATLYYKKPDKVHVASKGFTMVPRESMGMQFSKLSERYAVDSVRAETASKPAMYRLVMHPRDERSAIRKIVLVVNSERWTPERIEIPQADRSLMKAEFVYQQVSGYWMPSKLTVSFAMAQADTTNTPPGNPFGGGPGARMNPRGAGRTGTITVQYAEYKINTGLGDEVFVEPGEPK